MPPTNGKICSPAAQPTYPIPDPKHETTSLQNPTQPIQTYLYNFDERRGLLTEKAAKRMRKDYRTEKDAFPFYRTLNRPSTTPPKNTDNGHGDIGKRRRDMSPAPAPQKQAKATQAANPPTTNQTSFRIKKCTYNVTLFPPTNPPNRRFLPHELPTEIELASWMKRPVRTFINDKPFYPWLPPEPYVNFMLNYKE